MSGDTPVPSSWGEGSHRGMTKGWRHTGRAGPEVPAEPQLAGGTEGVWGGIAHLSWPLHPPPTASPQPKAGKGDGCATAGTAV